MRARRCAILKPLPNKHKNMISNREKAGWEMEKNNDMREDDYMSQICPKCENGGIMTVPNGPDDYDQEFCTCIAGENARHIAENEIIHHTN